MKKLKEWADLRYASDGISPEYVLVYNGKKYRTVDAYIRIYKDVSRIEKTRALLQVVLETAIRQELKKNRCWLDDKEFKVAWEEHVKPFQNTVFSIDVIALKFKGYPSMEAYRSRFRLEEGFRRMLKKNGEMDDEHLKKFIPEVERFLGDGAVEAEFIRIPAKDDKTNKWLPGGYYMAKAKAEMLVSQLQNGIVTFEEAREKFGSWPPVVTHGGILGRKSRNELRKELGESEYTDFIFGYSLGDLAFDKIPEGKVAGPIKGMDGYYIVKVVKRYPPARPISLENPRDKELLEQEYLTRRFLAWANEVAERCKVE